MKKIKLVMALIVSIVLVVASTPGVWAQQAKPITLTYAFYYGLNNRQGIVNEAWTKKIEKDTNGRVKFKIYPGGTLMSPRESYEEIKKGVADITTVTVGYSPHGFDIHKGTMAFMFGLEDVITRIKLFKNEIIKDCPEFMEEFKETKIIRFSAGDYQLMTRKPVKKIEDLKGMTLKATGLYTQFIEACGGEGVPLPMSETYIALQKGTVDGVLAPYETLASFKFAEVIPYVTKVNFTMTPFPGEAMNLNTWNKLPADIQKIIMDSQDWWEALYKKTLLVKNEEGIAFAKQKGVEFITPTTQEMNRFYKTLETVCLKSAADLDARGFNGTKIYKEIRRAVESVSAK